VNKGTVLQKAEWYNKNKDRIRKKYAAWAIENKHIVKLRSKAYNLKYKEKIKQYKKEAYQKNKDKIIQKFYNRLKTDASFRACVNVRNRVNSLLRNKAKYSKSLGCSYQEFKTYIEAKFQSGMTWDNYGDWHIDHKYPLSLAYNEGPESFAKACHYTNLQPLWAKDNISKGNKV
jgi:hypothetical protein